MTRTEKWMRNRIKKALSTPEEGATYKIVFCEDPTYQGYAFTTYAMGNTYFDPKERRLIRKALIAAVKGLNQLMYDVDLDKLGNSKGTYEFDTLVIRNIEYKVLKDREEVSVRLLYLKDGKEINPLFEVAHA